MNSKDDSLKNVEKLDSMRKEVTEKYEDLINKEEEKIKQAKKFEKKYFETKDENRQIIEQIHSRNMEMEKMREENLSSEQEVVDQLKKRISQLQDEKQELQNSLQQNVSQTKNLKQEITLFQKNKQEQQNQDVKKELEQALKKITALEQQLQKIKEAKEKEIEVIKVQIKSERIIALEEKLNLLDDQIDKVQDKFRCETCHDKCRTIHELTERVMDLERNKSPVQYHSVQELPVSTVYTKITNPMTFRHSSKVSTVYEYPQRYPRISRIERIPSISRSRSTTRYLKERISPSKSYEKSRRVKEIRTFSPVLNYNRSYVVNGVEQGPVIEGYTTHIEKFANPFDEKVVKNVTETKTKTRRVSKTNSEIQTSYLQRKKDLISMPSTSKIEGHQISQISEKKNLEAESPLYKRFDHKVTFEYVDKSNQLSLIQ